MRLIGLGEVMALTRYLGLEQYGSLTLAYAYWSLCALIVEAGIDVTLVREASQNPARLAHLVSNGMMLRALIALAAFVGALLALPWLGYDPEQRMLFSLTLVLILFSPLAVSRVIFLVLQRIGHIAVIDLVGQLVHTACILLAILLHGSLMQIVSMQIVATALTQVCSVYCGWRLLPHTAPLRLDWHVWRALFWQSWPILLSSLCTSAYLPISRLIVGRVLGSADAGLYTVALNLSLIFNVLPTFYFASVYPLLAQAYTTDTAYFQQLYRFSFKVMMLFIFPVALLMSLTGRELIRLYAGPAYLAGTPVFSVMAWTTVFVFAGQVVYYLLLATRQQHLLPGMTLLFLCVQVGAMALLLPTVGLIGTAIATLGMYIVAFCVYTGLAMTRTYVLEWLSASIRPALAAALIGIGLSLIHVSAAATWLIGLTTYGIIIVLIGGIQLNDIRNMRQMLHIQ
jgi:O-antigen/teichoic acid export membrane protein